MNRALLLWLALGICFFGSLFAAMTKFPRAYDWQRTVISSLASPRDNPRGHFIAIAGLALSGLLLIPFESMLARRLEPHRPRWVKAAGKLFLVAAVFLLLSALVVPGHYRVLGLGRTHEHLAQISGVAFCVSLVIYLAAVLKIPRLLPWLRAVALILVALPMTALVVSRAALVSAYELSNKSLYLEIRSSLWCSLALWEWIGAVCIYLFLGLIILALPSTQSRRD